MLASRGVRVRFATLIEALRSHGAERPSRTAVRFLLDGESRSVSWTYAELDRRADAIASCLRRLGVAGRPVLLAHPPGLEFIAAVFGCFYAGAIAVPTYPPRPRAGGRADTRLAGVIEDASPAVALTDEEHLPAGPREIEWLATDGSSFREPAAPGESSPDPHSLAMLQYTSGSTRSPLGVMLSHSNLMDNQRAIAEAMGHDETSRFVSWLPPYHDMGLIGTILQPIALGAEVTLMAPAHAIERPLRWLEAISRTRGTTSGAPDSIFAHCVRAVSPREREGLDLSSWRIAFNGSEPVRSETMERFVEAFGPSGFRADAFFPCYGLAEATLLVAGRSSVRLERRHGPDGARVVSCGMPARGFDVAIVDAESLREKGDGEIGEIWLSGNSVARGYWNRPDLSRATFENALPERPGRFLRTGDLGFLREGSLFVAGRLKDLVVLSGRNFFPQDVEACAGESHPALSPAKCAAFGVDGPGGERLVVACEMPRAAPPDVHADALVTAIRNAVLDELEIAVSAVQMLAPGALPRTTSGKVRRGACRDAFVSGTWDVVHEWPNAIPTAEPLSSPLFETIAREAAAVLNARGRALDPKGPLAGQGLDSLARVELILRLETTFGMAFDASSVAPDATIADLAAAVARALEGRSRHAESSPRLS